MRVMNLAQPSPPLFVEVIPSEAAELLMSIVAITDVGSGSDDIGSYDLGIDRLRSIHDAADPGLLRDIDRLTTGCGKVAASLLGYVHHSAPPHGISELLATLESTDPLHLYISLLDYSGGRKRWRSSTIDLLTRAAHGDPEARRDFLASAKRHEKNWFKRDFEELLDLAPERAARLLIGTIERWTDEVLPAFGEEWRTALQRDAASKRDLVDHETPERAIELATNGVQYVPEPDIASVVLFPTYILRPWVLISDDEDAKIFCYPVSDESLDVDASEPPPQLVKLYKALGDASRLRLLRRLAQGSMSLKEATELLGSAKSTAYHHLAILRQAGLVYVREDEDNFYTLRDDLIPQASELLQGYLGRSAAPARLAPLASSAPRAV